MRCGVALSTCERCGAELVPDALFCPSCGHRTTDTLAPGDERKRVTVLFADVVGSTGLGELLDPEPLGDVLDLYFSSMRHEIEAEGGTVEKYIGDAIVAVFGVPLAHEDDPTRALRAALRMRRRLETLNQLLEEAHGVRIGMRIGVNTGEVVARADLRADEGLVTGDAVNVAARLEQGADEGQILVGERTARAAKGLTFRDVGPLSLRGKHETVRTFELLDDDVREPLTAQRFDARLYRTKMVGRAAELTMLHSLFDRCVADRRPQLVTIYGDAGVGKTRLVEEFVGAAESAPTAPTVISGRCLPYGEGVTYWPLSEILKSRAGILDTDDPALALEKVRKVAADLITKEVSSDPARAHAALAYTIGLEDEGAALSRSDPHDVRDELHAAWRSYFSALALAGPLIVIVEDIHWADEALLDLLDDVAERTDGPALFLCPARPELTSRRPDWGGGRWNHASVLLEPLSSNDASHLLDLLLDEGAMGADLRSSIIERAGGNPFFLEEIVQRLLDEPTTAGEFQIPDTVQGVLAARIDLLSPPEKRVLQSAAVVGRTFWSGAVRETLEPDPGPRQLDEILARLEDRGLVHAKPGSSIVGERQFSFRHILIKDVAYEGLTRRERARAHALVAGWIERQTKDRGRGFAELLAHHYEHAYRAQSTDARPDPVELERLRASAFGYAALAASDASRKLALHQAQRFAQQALALADGPAERARALEILGTAYFHDYQGDLAWQRLKEAIDLLVAEGLDTGSPASGTVARLCATALEVVTRARGTMRQRISRDEGERYLELGLAAAGPDDSEDRARLLVARTFAPHAFRDTAVTESEVEHACRIGEEAAAMAARLGRVDLESAALDGITSARQSLGRYGDMEDPIRRRLRLVPELTDAYEIGDIHAMAAWWALDTGRYQEALALATRGFDAATPESPAQGLYCLDFRVAARFRLGDWDGALADVSVARELLGDRRDTPPGFAPMHLGIAAFIHDARGEMEMASHYLQVVRWLEREEERFESALTLWQARILARRGAFEDARVLLERPGVSEDRRGRDEVLEAWCEVISEQRAWEEADAMASEMRAHAAWAGEPPLDVFATRLSGRAAAGRLDLERADSLLADAAGGFQELGARWEGAVTALDRSQVMTSLGKDVDARALAADAATFFEEAGSVRELTLANRLADRS
jgi:class 3 adenylate cyclase